MNKGFTLIETIIYVGIFALIVGGMMVFAFAMLTTSQRSTVQQELADNTRFAAQKLEYVLRGATGINSPLVGSSGSTLSIAMASASLNPLVVDAASGSLRFKSSTGLAIPITNSWVTVSSVSFRNYRFSPGTGNTIRFKAKFSSVDPTQPVSHSLDLFFSTK